MDKHDLDDLDELIKSTASTLRFQKHIARETELILEALRLKRFGDNAHIKIKGGENNGRD